MLTCTYILCINTFKLFNHLKTLGMKKVYLFITALQMLAIYCVAQNTFPSTGSVGIGTTSPNASSLLEVKSTTKGVLFPRMTKAQRDLIASPATGLLIYQTDNTTGFYYYNGGWKVLTPSVSGYANKALSNLTAPTAVNVDLLPNATNTRYLGSATLAWKDLYLRGYVNLDAKRFVSNAPGTFALNTFLGTDAGKAVTSGTSNTAVGHNALFNDTSGAANSATGAYALYNNSNGGYNTGNGYHALYSNTIGLYNTGNGTNSLAGNTEGSFNIADGYASLYQNTGGVYNTGIGSLALYSNLTGNFNSALGYYANVSGTDFTNSTAIGANSIATASNQIALGSSDVTSVRLNTTSGIPKYLEFVKTTLGTVGWRFEHNTSGRYLYVSSSINNFSGFSDRAVFDTAVVNGYVFHVFGKAIGNAWVVSDVKLKKNVTDFTNAMDIINKLKPKTYLYKKSEYAYLNLPSEKQYGLIAQELETVLPELVTTSMMPVAQNGNGERKMEEIKAVNYTELIPVLIRAMQEQQKQIEELKNLVSQLTSGKTTNTSPALSSYYLKQNTPNPVGNSTVISYNVPDNINTAQIVITDEKGSTLKRFSVSKGTGLVTVNTRDMASGSYTYTLYVDEKKIDAKQMVIMK